MFTILDRPRPGQSAHGAGTNRPVRIALLAVRVLSLAYTAPMPDIK